ncbi:Acetate--CoA ligase [ADP-forming] II subunit alpha [uncultured archaeon]|nr:Acetate--CoA ligase [ADP-forming] II subunit alpha [uncultured archaeon]
MKRTILIVGASKNPSKYGHTILDTLQKRGFEAVPINPNEREILGVKAYASISDFVKENPRNIIEWIDFVVPPEVTQKVLLEVKMLGLKNVWLQPGSESDSAIEFCKEKGIICMHHKCIMKDYK